MSFLVRTNGPKIWTATTDRHGRLRFHLENLQPDSARPAIDTSVIGRPQLRSSRPRTQACIA
jgi:hypothetical protein